MNAKLQEQLRYVYFMYIRFWNYYRLSVAVFLNEVTNKSINQSINEQTYANYTPINYLKNNLVYMCGICNAP